METIDAVRRGRSLASLGLAESGGSERLDRITDLVTRALGLPISTITSAAMNHASLNVANALGAWLGGLAIAAGWGLRSPALIGLALSLVGVAILLVSARLHVRERSPGVGADVLST